MNEETLQSPPVLNPINGATSQAERTLTALSDEARCWCAILLAAWFAQGFVPTLLGISFLITVASLAPGVAVGAMRWKRSTQRVLFIMSTAGLAFLFILVLIVLGAAENGTLADQPQGIFKLLWFLELYAMLAWFMAFKAVRVRPPMPASDGSDVNGSIKIFMKWVFFTTDPASEGAQVVGPVKASPDENSNYSNPNS